MIYSLDKYSRINVALHLLLTPFILGQTTPVLYHCTDVHFAIFPSGRIITAIVVNPPEKKLAKHTYVHCCGLSKIFWNRLYLNFEIC